MSIIISIIILCIVIMFHELGHFLLAKACGIKVNEFAFGLGPKILSFKKGDTVYSWRAVPIGGMCAMQGENEDDFSKGSFQAAKVYSRILVVAAGPVFNFILAFLCALIVIFSIGADPCTVTSVENDSPAAEAGLKEGDLILRYEGHSISNARELYLYTYMDGLPDDGYVNLTVKRDNNKVDLEFALDEQEVYMLGFSYQTGDNGVIISDITEGLPLASTDIRAGDKIIAINNIRISSSEELSLYLSDNPLDGSIVKIEYERDGIDYTAEAASVLTINQTGGFYYNMARQKMDVFSSLSYTFGEIKYWINSTLKSLLGLFNGTFGLTDLSGPVGIVSAVDTVYEEAAVIGVFYIIMSMLNMTILISANLGVINLLPLPALDGGRLLFLLVEVIRGKRCDQAVEGMVHFVGILAFFALAAFIAYNDIIKLL